MTISLFGSRVKYYSLEISLLYKRDSTVPSSNRCILATNRSGPRMCPQILKFKQVLPNDLIFSLAYQWCDYTSSVSPITGVLDWIGGGILGVLRNGGRGVGFRQTVRRGWWWCLLDRKIFRPVGRFPFSKLESNDKLVPVPLLLLALLSGFDFDIDLVIFESLTLLLHIEFEGC